MSFTASLAEIVSRNSNGLLGARQHWSRVRLGDVCEILNGFPFASEQFSVTEGTPLLRIRDIVPGRTKTFYKGSFDPTFTVEAGELVIGMDGDFNCTLWPSSPALLNQRVCKVTPSSASLSRRFLRYVLPGYLAAINAHTSAITVKHLSSRTLAEIPVPLPSLWEQEEIVGYLDEQLSRVDASVAALLRAQANLKRYRTSVLKAACEGRLVRNEAELAREGGRDFETGAQLLQRILANQVARRGSKPKSTDAIAAEAADVPLPPGWTLATVAQLGELVQYGTSAKTGTWSDSAIPVLRMGNIVDGEFDLAKLKYLPAEHSEFPDLLLHSGDLLFNRTNSPELVGKSAVYLGTPVNASFASYLIRVRAVPEFKTEYLSFVINSVFGRNWIRSVATQQVGQANVSGSKLQAFSVPLLPLAEQHRIIAEVDRRFSLIRAAEAQVTANLTRAKRLRQSILQAAFESPASAGQ